MTRREYFDELKKHDWYYNYSDDQRYYNAGNQNKIRLLREAEGDPIKRMMFQDFLEYVFSGKPFGTEKKQEPMLVGYDLEGD